MPSWRFHIITGIIITIFLVYTCFYLNLWYLFVNDGRIQFLFWYHIFFITMLGSLMPDFDYRKTRIRHGLGPSLGLFMVISLILSAFNDHIPFNPIYLAVLLPVFILVPLIAGLIIRFKHHGTLHSGIAAIVYSIIWVLIEIIVFKMTIAQAGTIGVFGFIGFISHLVLDRDLKWY